jgi:hypothetical protein
MGCKNCRPRIWKFWWAYILHCLKALEIHVEKLLNVLEKCGSVCMNPRFTCNILHSLDMKRVQWREERLLLPGKHRIKRSPWQAKKLLKQ